LEHDKSCHLKTARLVDSPAAADDDSGAVNCEAAQFTMKTICYVTNLPVTTFSSRKAT